MGCGGRCYLGKNTAAEHVAGPRKETGRMRVRSPHDTEPSPCISVLAGYARLHHRQSGEDPKSSVKSEVIVHIF